MKYMKLVNSKSFKDYQLMTDSQLIEETKIIMVKNIRELISCNNNLAKELYHRGLTNNVFFKSETKIEKYSVLDNDELLNYALNLINIVGIQGLNALRKYDGVLYKILTARQLTKDIAKKANFINKGRETKKKILKKSKEVPKRFQYGQMSDIELYDEIIQLKHESPTKLNKFDSVLYSELNRIDRIQVKIKVHKTLGWRRIYCDYRKLDIKGWVEICKQFESKQKFHTDYSAAYAKVIKTEYWNKVCNIMYNLGYWSSLYGLDGKNYQSKAELIVANWLYEIKINKKSHPKLIFDSKKYYSDFYLSDINTYIEVFMFSERSFQKRADLPNWADGYYAKRLYKEKKYRENILNLIIIEAEIYRLDGIEKYKEHIFNVFNNYGIKLPLISNERLLFGTGRKGLDWTLDDFVNYADEMGWDKLSDFQKNEISLYNVLILRKMRLDVENLLNDKYGRKKRAIGANLIPLEILKDYCLNNNITMKKEYEKAYKESDLPMGAPADIRQSYGTSWAEFFGRRFRFDLWPWEKAREYVRSRGFKSKAEFTQAVTTETDTEMKYIRRNSGNRTSGGYSEFIDWYDFLGKR